MDVGMYGEFAGKTSAAAGVALQAERTVDLGVEVKRQGAGHANYPHLDFVRSIAVMLVFIGHLLLSLGHPYGSGTAAHFGVVVFFVHTCLVLFFSMERLSREHFFLRFYVRRIARIYPLSIVAVLFVLLARFPPAPWILYSVPDWHAIVANILLIQNLTHHESIIRAMWSLPFEVQMYISLPVLFLLHTRRRFSALAIWATGTLFSSALWLLPSDEAATICQYVPCFCAGIVSYSMLGQKRSQRFSGLAVSLALTLIATVAAGHWHVPLALLDGCAALAVALIIGRCSVLPASVARVSATIAKYSYGIYLAHLPIMWFCFSAGQRRWVTFACLSIIVPVALYHVIEHPFIKLGARCFPLSPQADRGNPRIAANA